MVTNGIITKAFLNLCCELQPYVLCIFSLRSTQRITWSWRLRSDTRAPILQMPSVLHGPPYRLRYDIISYSHCESVIRPMSVIQIQLYTIWSYHHIINSNVTTIDLGCILTFCPPLPPKKIYIYIKILKTTGKWPTVFDRNIIWLWHFCKYETIANCSNRTKLLVGFWLTYQNRVGLAEWVVGNSNMVWTIKSGSLWVAGVIASLPCPDVEIVHDAMRNLLLIGWTSLKLASDWLIWPQTDFWLADWAWNLLLIGWMSLKLVIGWLNEPETDQWLADYNRDGLACPDRGTIDNIMLIYLSVASSISCQSLSEYSMTICLICLNSSLIYLNFDYLLMWLLLLFPVEVLRSQ